MKGPAITVDTACSSSLVALNIACDQLNNGRCEMALVGGVTLLTTPEMYIWLSRAEMLSAQGRCRPFDHGADGVVPGEAVAAVVLKSLSQAQKDGDHIYGIIKGIGVNQDGRTNGIMAPSAPSQRALEEEVYTNYRIDPATISYVEAHGTGTVLGDPIEIEALGGAFAKFTNRKQFCALGSVKSNIGHSMAASGITGLIKILLCLRHKKSPPLCILKRPIPILILKKPLFTLTQASRNGRPATPIPVVRL